jgi:hypothetical protein
MLRRGPGGRWPEPAGGGGPAGCWPPQQFDREPFERGSLADLDQAWCLFGRYPAYRACLEWLEGFITRHDPRIGRPGAVCPLVAPAMRRNLIRLVSVRTTESSAEEAADTCIHLAGLYEALFPDPRDFRAGALIAFFPYLDPSRAPEFIDGGHRLLRMEFVSRGLMLGEFHPASDVASVRNPEFLVMRSPVPLFVVRALSVHDLMFLDRPAYPAAERARYVAHLQRHLDAEASRCLRARLRNETAEGGAAP